MRISVPSVSTGFVCTDIFTMWAAEIEAESDGRIDVEVLCDSTLSRPGDTVTRVAAGVADAGFDLPNVYGARFAHYGVVGIPGLGEDASDTAAALWSLQEDGTFPAIPGVKMAMFQVQNTVMVWTREPLATATDLAGQRIIAGSALRGMTISGMGGVPLSLRVPEYYQALARGAAEGVMTNAGAFLTYSYHEMVPNGYVAPWGAGVSIVFLNEAWYDSLPDDLKAVIDNNTGAETSRWASDLFQKYEEEELQTLQTAGSITLTELSEADLTTLEPAFAAVRNHWVATTENGAAYLSAFEAAYAAQ